MSALEYLASLQRVMEVEIYRDQEDMESFICAVKFYDSRSWFQRFIDPSYPTFGIGDTPEEAIAQAATLVRYRLFHSETACAAGVDGEC